MSATRRSGDRTAVNDSPKPFGHPWLEIASFAAVVAALAAVFLYVPTERSMGVVQRIFYFHVPSAFMAFLSFFTVFVASALYLWREKPVYDRVAATAAEIGVLFSTLVLLTGPLWAKPVWNVWWTWDSRLTTTLILWLLYLGYLMIRKYGDSRSSRFAAVLGIVAFLDVPIIHMSVRWWRTLHPEPVFLAREGVGAGMEPEMVQGLLVCIVAFLALAATLWVRRAAIEKASKEIESLRFEIRERQEGFAQREGSR